MNRVENMIERLRAGLDRAEIIALLSDPNPSVRGTAVQSLAEGFGEDPHTIGALECFIGRAENRKPVMGTISLSHLAMRLLATIQTPPAQAAFDRLRNGWPDDDRADLEWFLRNG